MTCSHPFTRSPEGQEDLEAEAIRELEAMGRKLAAKRGRFGRKAPPSAGDSG